MDEIYESQYTGEEIDSGVGNGLKLDGKTIVTALGNDDTTIPTSKAVKDSQSNFVTTTDLSTALENKVDKVAGKGLSTNDFTNADKSKVDVISTTSLTYYVDGTNGSDDNDGLSSATAFATIGKAVSVSTFSLTNAFIHIEEGTYNENVNISAINTPYLVFEISAGKTVTIGGNITISSNCTVLFDWVSGGSTLVINGTLTVQRMARAYFYPVVIVNPSGAVGIAVNKNAYANFEVGVTINGGTSTEAINVNDGSQFGVRQTLTINTANIGIYTRGGLSFINSLSVSNVNTKLTKLNGGMVKTGAGVDLT